MRIDDRSTWSRSKAPVQKSLASSIHQFTDFIPSNLLFLDSSLFLDQLVVSLTRSTLYITMDETKVVKQTNVEMQKKRVHLKIKRWVHLKIRRYVRNNQLRNMKRDPIDNLTPDILTQAYFPSKVSSGPRFSSCPKIGAFGGYISRDLASVLKFLYKEHVSCFSSPVNCCVLRRTSSDPALHLVSLRTSNVITTRLSHRPVFVTSFSSKIISRVWSQERWERYQKRYGLTIKDQKITQPGLARGAAGGRGTSFVKSRRNAGLGSWLVTLEARPSSLPTTFLRLYQ